MRLRLMRIPRLRIIFGAPRASKCPAGAELLKGRLVQRPHIKIAFSPPFVARDVPQSRAYQHKRDLPSGKFPTTLVRLLSSRLIRSGGLFVRILRQ